MVPGDLRPGADGELLIGGGRQCLFEPASAEPPGGPQRMPFRSIVVDLPDDEGSFSVTHFPPCSPIDDSGLGVPPPPQPDAVVTPTAGTLASLQARARVPERVQAGRRLDYVVVLSNRGSKAISLMPCPGYTESLGAYVGGSWQVAKHSYELNCSGVSRLLPDQSVTFAMQIPVPHDAQPGGPTKLGGGSTPATVRPLEVL